MLFEILARVQQLYEQADQLPAADREMLDLPLADRLLQPIQTLKQWLTITGPTVSQCIRDFNTRLQRCNNDISNIFPLRERNGNGTPEIPPPISKEQSGPPHTRLRHRGRRNGTFLPWRDVRNRKSTINPSDENSPLPDPGTQREATPEGQTIQLTQHRQESLSPCRK